MLLTTQEAARELRLTKATLEAWRCRGGGPAFVKFGRAVRYRREDLEKFLISSLRSNTSNG
ncbi:MAG: helix-turn-helix domain-containing protein [Desulfomonilia bacterium]